MLAFYHRWVRVRGIVRFSGFRSVFPTHVLPRVGLVSSGLRNCLDPCCACQAKFASMCRPFGCTVQYQESEADWTPRREEKNIHEKNPASKSLSCSSSSRSSSSLKAQQALSQRKPKKAKRKESSQGRRRESAKHGTCARTWLRRANRRRTCPWGKCWMSQGGFKNARAVDRNGWGPLLYSTPRL